MLVYEENRPRLQQIYDQIQAYPTLEPTGCAPVGFDVVATGVDKAHAISLVCDDLHLSMEQVICMGDGDNDIQMLQQAGLGVAMGNADDLVKASADVCAPSNDEDGVAWVLRNYCLTTPNTKPNKRAMPNGIALLFAYNRQKRLCPEGQSFFITDSVAPFV